jgi:hypothetical protein
MIDSDQILLFLVKNSVPEYHIYPVTKQEAKTKIQRLNSLLMRLSGSTRYTCESSKLKEFLGEEINFEKHLRPLYEAGILYFSGVPDVGSFYDAPVYRDNFRHSMGQIRDYNSNISYVAFWYRENDFLNDLKNIEENAEELGLYKVLKPKCRKKLT